MTVKNNLSMRLLSMSRKCGLWSLQWRNKSHFHVAKPLKTTPNEKEKLISETYDAYFIAILCHVLITDLPSAFELLAHWPRLCHFYSLSYFLPFSSISQSRNFNTNNQLNLIEHFLHKNSNIWVKWMKHFSRPSNRLSIKFGNSELSKSRKLG